MTVNVQPKKNSVKTKSYLIGVGASAGGLEAVHAMFDAMPENTGFSFVIIQHLSPDHKSLLAELLSKHTVMQVFEAENGMEIKPNCIYVIPSKKLISVYNGKLKLVEKIKTGLPNNAIDVFFTSLAEEKTDCAVGVILSGTGSDGRKGIEEIKRKKGIVVVQDPMTAAFDGMPNSAIDSGVADLVLPPEMIAEELLEYIKGSPFLRSFTVINQKEERTLRQILSLLHDRTKYDFTHYKKPTILRRLAKRMSEINIQHLDEYRDYLETHHEEPQMLYRQFLINVTKFFRDPEAFDVLRTTVIPAIVAEKKDDDVIKVWVAACSTGEEAYSIAMIFKEYLDKIKKKDNAVKIFATDIDAEALEIASRGCYSEALIQGIPPNYIKKYFIKEGNSYRIDTALRKLIVFANHDVLKDPPFSHLDLVACRNMLIYIDPLLQKKVLKKFQFALNISGYLMLGLSENISILKNSMQEVNRKWKIYKCINKAPITEPDNYLNSFDGKIFSQKSIIPKAKNPIQNIGEIFKDTLLDTNKCAGIMIDREFEVKHAIGDFKKYFSFPEESFNFNLLKLVPQDIGISLGVCVRKAMNQGEPVIMRRVKMAKGDSTSLINIIVKPYLQVKEYLQPFLFIVLQEEEAAFKEVKAITEGPVEAGERVVELERELAETRDNLQAIIEEVETANEELQSSNEEMISFNEELQSTNEELQSLNEELHTVSAEHQLKIKELLELNDDMDNYFNNSDIGQIIVDRKMIIRKFSPAVSQMVNLIEADIGRSIVDITTNIKNVDFVNEIKAVMKTNTSVEKEVTIGEGNFFSLRIRPYLKQDKTTDGAVINFIDITETKSLNSIVEGIFNSSTSGIVAVKPIYNADGLLVDFEYMAVNESAESIMRVEHKGVVGKTMIGEFPATQQSFISLCKEVITTGATKSVEYFNDGTNKWFDIVVVKMLQGLVITFTDITDKKSVANLLAKNYEDLKAASKELKESNEKLEESNFDLMQFASIASHDLKEPLRKVQAFGNLLESKVKEKLDGDETLYLNKIITAATRMQLLIEDVLTLSKLSNKDLPFEKVNLSNILKRILEDLEITIKEKKAEVACSELPIIEAVPGQVHQVFQNLMANALKFNDKEKPKIVIAAAPITTAIEEKFRIKRADYTCIKIADNGMGFEDEYREKIFGIFQRLHGRNFEGTGIGLAIAKKIIENHNGCIWAESKMGEGSTFFILLPCKQKTEDAQAA